jgi:glycosyltransferase involved in cell wall biosynthesis
MKDGRILIVVPVYNGLPYLPETLKSILCDLPVEADVLLVDDGSTDGTGEYLDSVIVEIPNVTIVHKKNGGPAAAMNFALDYAVQHGYTFLARSDADDINLPQRFKYQRSFLLGHPDTAAVSGNAYYRYGQRRVGSSTVPVEPQKIKAEVLSGQRGLIQGCTMFRVEYLQAIGGYREEFTHSEDADIFMRLAERYPLGNVPEFVYEIRLHATSHSVAGVSRNTRMARYALMCSRARQQGKAEPDLASFLSRPSIRDQIWEMRENLFLAFWRQSLSANRKAAALGWHFLAGLSDPVRVWRRLQRAWGTMRVKEAENHKGGEMPERRLAFVTNFIQHYRVQTFEELASRLEVEFFLFSKGNEKYWLPEHGTRQGQVKATQLKGFTLAGITVSPSLPWHLIRGDYDVFLSGVVGKFSMPVTFLCAKLTGKPFILWSGIWQRIDTRIHRLIWPLTKYVYRHADAVVVYGEHIKRYLIGEGVAAERIFVADHAVQNENYNKPPSPEKLRQLREQYGIPEASAVVLYLGRLVEEKGVSDLIKAFVAIDPSTHLVIAGTGPEREWLGLIAQSFGISERVHFVGYIQPDEAYLYFALAIVSVLPSHTTADHKEPWGLTVNESFNQGTPVIASDSVGAAAGGFLRHGLDGLIYPEGDWRALHKALQLVVSDKTRQDELSQQARQRVAEWDNRRMIDGFMRAIDYVSPGRR